MLELRPNCECCDIDLPPDSLNACICSYECTFCKSCVNNILKDVCPNCGGDFSSRPIRPASERRDGVSLKHQPASTTRVNTKYTQQQITEFSDANKPGNN
ncbi:MAG: urease [SAR86 cluster bacterium]|uniref:Urease n=1 Tax=SAR86 cluster bacterium TaxID=2030880 RepID=A0A2A5AUE9_9GAMM|nr:MAG: urease [SAR86 cluster bacterium]